MDAFDEESKRAPPKIKSKRGILLPLQHKNTLLSTVIFLDLHKYIFFYFVFTIGVICFSFFLFFSVYTMKFTNQPNGGSLHIKSERKKNPFGSFYKTYTARNTYLGLAHIKF